MNCHMNLDPYSVPPFFFPPCLASHHSSMLKSYLCLRKRWFSCFCSIRMLFIFGAHVLKGNPSPPSLYRAFIKGDVEHMTQHWEQPSKRQTEKNCKNASLLPTYLLSLTEIIWRYNFLVNQIRLQKWSKSTEREENCLCKNWLQNWLLQSHLQLMLRACVIWPLVIPSFIFLRKIEVLL